MLPAKLRFYARTEVNVSQPSIDEGVRATWCKQQPAGTGLLVYRTIIFRLSNLRSPVRSQQHHTLALVALNRSSTVIHQSLTHPNLENLYKFQFNF
jgi:hypothetical protein